MSQANGRFVWGELTDADETVTVVLDGEPVTVPAGVTVAAAVLGHDDQHFCSSAEAGERRSPYCLMGVCFECLVDIDGKPNRQACLEPVRDGMRVDRPCAARGAGDER